MIDRYVAEEVFYYSTIWYKVFDKFLDRDREDNPVCICMDKRDAENIVDLLNKQDKGE